MERKMFDTPVLPRLETILEEVASGDLVIPEFQRPFVWDDDRRLNLLDSIVKGMPIGSLLVWRTSLRELHTYKKVGGIHLPGIRKGSEKVNYLIDGHQRISTLFGALYTGPREQSNDDNDVRWPLYYELGANNRPAFRVPPRRREDVPDHWLRLDIILDGDKLFDFTQRLRSRGARDLAKEAERLANVFRDYIIPIIPLVTEEIDVVTDAFVRINSQGKGMTEAHMLRALTYLGEYDTNRAFEEVRARLEPLGWGDLDDQVLVNVLKAVLGLDVYASSVRGIRDHLQQSPEPLRYLGTFVEEAVEVLDKVGIAGPGSLPYAYQLVTLATLASLHTGKLCTPGFLAHLKDWFWRTTYTEYFSGSTGRRISEGIDQLDRELRGAPPLRTNAVPVKPLTEVRRGTVRSSAFLLFMAQLPENEAARRRRMEWLGTGGRGSVPSLLSIRSAGYPGNRVIADPSELRALRHAIHSGNIPPAMADEFAIPAEAIAALPNHDVFLMLRGKSLVFKEEAFIESLGLSLADNDA